MRKIVDVTLYNNELHVLDLRVNILQDVVDVFYVVQATQTFSGLPRKILESYDHPKVKLVTIDFPDGLTTWDRDHYQRNYKVDVSGYSADDIVLISDLDEIPNPDVVEFLRENFDETQSYSFSQIMHQYYLNNQNISEPWAGTRAVSVGKYLAPILVPQALRDTEANIGLANGGWHWSFLGDEEFLKAKIESYAHQEYNNRFTLDSIVYRKDDNKDIFDRGFILKTVELDEQYPKYVRENQELLAPYIKKV